MADDAAFVRGDQEAVLGHRVEKARSFERNGLAAGVRAGDDEGVVLAAQLDVHRHDLFLSMSGWRALFSLKCTVSLTAGIKAFCSTASRAFASSRSILSIAS